MDIKRLFGMISTKASAAYTHEALKTFSKHTKLSPQDSFLLIDNDADWNGQNEIDGIEFKILKNISPQGFAQNANTLIERAISNNADLYLLNNDLIFTDGWDTSLASLGDKIVCPLSNREVRYASAIQVISGNNTSRTFVTEMQMGLESYLGNEYTVQAMAETHRSISTHAHMPVLVMPYFAVRLPLKIMKTVGLFDTEFGQAGGEDYDYSLRAWLQGFETAYALDAWIIHFYGKSSWDGVEKTTERQQREEIIFKHFEKKWGKLLKQIIFEEKDKLIEELGYKMPGTAAEFSQLVKELSNRK